MIDADAMFPVDLARTRLRRLLLPNDWIYTVTRRRQAEESHVRVFAVLPGPEFVGPLTDITRVVAIATGLAFRRNHGVVVVPDGQNPERELVRGWLSRALWGVDTEHSLELRRLDLGEDAASLRHSTMPTARLLDLEAAMSGAW